ncbi:MLO-like protein 6 [Hibiscus syriacus]|uniref:MLO-like protein n=1 Tax=Hibiscus syriacus TaxID=106335 RepID=A0A6A2Y0L2_HIBSY|nr:MLO-like protein 6 [Hibiscus syriacus]
MAGASGGRSLEETPTWAVAVVCFVLVLISVIIEQVIHMIGKWLRKNHKRALYEALEKIKSELMLLGFISLLLTVGQGLISDICISKEIAATWHPCNKKQKKSINEPGHEDNTDTEHRRRLNGKVPFVSSDGIHHLHIFIFVLALFHVLYCVLTLALGRAKIRNGSDLPEKHHLEEGILAFGPKTRFSCGLSLEEDFNVVVGISPPIWFLAVLFLLFNTHGWYSYLWMPFIPLIVILLVGTKLQVIITKMGLRIHERGEVVKGVPVVQPGDDLFWFNRPRLILYLINFVLFQNAFQLAFFAWTWYEFGLKSCFHEHVEDVVIRISMGVLIQILCSYVTLPLYALVTQMGSNIDGSSTSHCHIDVVEQDQVEYVDKDVNESSLSEQCRFPQHEINIGLKEFSFDKRTTSI